MTLQERFLRLRRVDPVDGAAGVRESEGEHVTLRLDSGQNHPDFAEVDLGLRAGGVQLRHERLHRPPAGFDLDLHPPGTDVVAHRSVGDVGVVLVEEAVMNPGRGMPLLSWRVQIDPQHLVDRRFERIQLRRGPDRRLPFRR